jgi:hypothetical protein
MESNDWRQSDQEALRELLDFEAVKSLKARYWRAIDQQRWDELRRLLCDDVDVDLAGHVHKDGDSFVSCIGEKLKGVITVHQGHAPALERHGPDSVTAYWPFVDYAIFPPSGERTSFQGYGYYEDVYRREKGTWRIASTKMSRYWIDLFPNLTTGSSDRWRSVRNLIECAGGAGLSPS